MKLQDHAIVSSGIAGLLLLSFKSWELALAGFISGIFIDLDHIIDVVREHGGDIRIKDFFHICHHGQFERIFLILHGWEWLIFWAVTAWGTGWNPWLTGALIGTFHHLVLDAYFNSKNILSYSLIWRWHKEFEFDTIFSNLAACKYQNKK